MHFPTWVDLKGQDSVPDTVHHVVCEERGREGEREREREREREEESERERERERERGREREREGRRCLIIKDVNETARQ